MTAKQAKEKTDEAYFKIQEEKINIKIDSTNEWIEKQSLKGSYSIDIDVEALDLLDVGIICLLVGLLFQLVTLPVEFNASTRAKDQ